MTDGTSDSGETWLVALGLVAKHSAAMEWLLRSVFCTLVGSKYAVIVSGGQSVTWLIEQCEALLKANLEVEDDFKQGIRHALRECRLANEQRNTLMHGLKITDWTTAGSIHTARSRRGTYKVQIQPWTSATIAVVADSLSDAAGQLALAVSHSFPQELLEIDQELNREPRQGHPKQSA